MKNNKTSLPVSLIYVAVATICILFIPFLAMQFTGEVNWSASDFVIMGILIFGTGSLYVLLTRYASNIIHRAAVAFAVGSTFLFIWANLAVGLIGGGPNAANLMYIAVVAIIITGTFLSRFTTKGMERVMFTAAIAMVFCAIIQLLAGMNRFAGSSITEVIEVNAFFAVLFAISGLLFRYAMVKQSTAVV